MKLIPLLVLTASLASANPFTTFWGWLTGRTEPPCIVNGAIADRNDATHRGPVCDKNEWNVPSVLEADVTSNQLANVKDPEEFSRERMKHQFPPTAAVFINFVALPKETPVTPRLLASAAQLARVQAHLKAAAAALEMPCAMSVYEHTRGLYGGTVDYRGEARRIYYAETEAFPGTGGILIAQVVAMFAANPSEAAQKYLRADVRTICTAPANRPARRPISD